MSIYHLGQVDRARRYARVLLDYNSASRFLGPSGKGAMGVICLLVLEDKEAAINEFTRAVDAGWLGYYQAELDNDVLYQDIKIEPRVQNLVKKIDQSLDEQKPLVYQELIRQGIVRSI